ncbi:MAG: hypothetical protein EBZ24_14490, partial [Synechococcaceae bacterium WB9_4xB_025]|nr:hypothetical protein [Synechococcaceae bacterium WB9_4xB_025]
ALAVSVFIPFDKDFRSHARPPNEAQPMLVKPLQLSTWQRKVAGLRPRWGNSMEKVVAGMFTLRSRHS